jgi:hypothetical protein
MPTINGQVNTYTAPSFRGELFAATPVETPIVNIIGGLRGGHNVSSTDFEWQGYDLRSAGQRAALEGAAAGAGDGRKRFNVYNTIQSQQEAFDISDVRIAATQNFGGVNNGQGDAVANEIDFQTNAKLAEVARDMEWSILNSEYSKPADNTAPRQTRGLRQATSTNVVAAAGADLSKDMVTALLTKVHSNGGARRNGVTLLADPTQILKLNDLYLAGRTETSREVAGHNLTTIKTPFGDLNLLMHTFAAEGELLLVDLDELDIAFLPIPGHSDVYVEELARVGTSRKFQVSTHWGLKYGNEKLHGKITGLAV